MPEQLDILGMQVDGQVRIRWCELTAVKNAIQRAAAEGITGPRPRFDIFDEDEGAWAHKTSDLIVLRRGEGLLVKLQAVTRPFRLDVYRALARPSQTTPLPALSTRLTTRHSFLSSPARAPGGPDDSHVGSVVPRGRKRSRSVSSATTPQKRDRATASGNCNVPSHPEAQGATIGHRIGASHNPQINISTTPTTQRGAHRSLDHASTQTHGNSSAKPIVLSDDECDSDDSVPDPLAFWWDVDTWSS